MKIKIPNAINLENILVLTEKMKNISNKNPESITIDFNAVSWVDPAGAVLLIQSIQSLQERHEVFYDPLNKLTDALGYAIRLGIFEKIGFKNPDTENWNISSQGSTFIAPIQYNFSEIPMEKRTDEAFYNDITNKIINQIIRSDYKGTEEIKNIIRHSINEIIRNVFHHSEFEKMFIAAQYIPKKNKIEFVISDNGVGLRETVPFDIEEKWNNENTDKNSILKAIQPGVTASSNHMYAAEDYKNSGYGIPLVKEIALITGGIFSIATGSSSLTYRFDKQKPLKCDVQGTLVRTVLNLDSMDDVSIPEIIKRLEEKNDNKASRASKGALR